MNYRETLNVVDTEKALSLIGIEFTANGAYLKFACPKEGCEGQAVIKTYGDKKNFYYCPKCKSRRHVISLAMSAKTLYWQSVCDLLTEKAATVNAKKNTEELNLSYTLQYHDFLKEKGFDEKTATFMEIGVPTGRTMLSGSVAFLVRDESGMKVSYYGIRMKDGKAVFHKFFNPELYLYNLCNVDANEPVYLTTDMFKCVRLNAIGKHYICNFGLPYLSNAHLDLLQDTDRLILRVDEKAVKSLTCG